MMRAFRSKHGTLFLPALPLTQAKGSLYVSSSMNSLRVYFDPAGADTQGGQRVFYSRRADGPYYCWHYEKKLGKWLSSRVHVSDLTRRGLSIASWSSVPDGLQIRLGEHYLE